MRDIMNVSLIVLFLFYCYFMIGGYTDIKCTGCPNKESYKNIHCNNTSYKNMYYKDSPMSPPNPDATYYDTAQQDQDQMNIYQKSPWI